MTRELLSVLSLATLLACAESPLEPGESLAQPVVEGEPSDTSQDGVLLLRGLIDDGTELICTATLVAPNLVLTARHCVAYLSEGLFSCNARGELEPEDAEGGRLGLHLPADTLEFYAGELPRRDPVARGQEVFSTLSPTVCNNDIAFVLLDRALDLPLLPIRLGRPAAAGERSVLVGFGMDETESPIDYRRQPRLQRRDLAITAVGPSSVNDGVTNVPPRSLLMRGAAGCIGDSGGPLLSQATGAVLGVYSLQEGESCTAPDVSQLLAHVPPFTALIAEAFAAAGAEPLPEPSIPDGASGEGGEGGQGGASQLPVPAEGGVGGAEQEPEPEPQPATREKPGCAISKLGDTDGSATWLLLSVGLLLARRRDR